MATYSSILAWKIPRTEEPGGLQSLGSQESDMTEQLSMHTPSGDTSYWQSGGSIEDFLHKKWMVILMLYTYRSGSTMRYDPRRNWRWDIREEKGNTVQKNRSGYRPGLRIMTGLPLIQKWLYLPQGLFGSLHIFSCLSYQDTEFYSFPHLCSILNTEFKNSAHK